MKDLDRIKEAYKRIRSLPSYNSKILDTFLRETVCVELFKEGAFWDYIQPILYWYSDKFKSPEFEKLFDGYFKTASKIAKELEQEFELTDKQCEEMENSRFTPCHPFSVGCGALKNAKEKEDLPTGKELWLQILKQAQEKDSYFVWLEGDDRLAKRIHWENNSIAILGHFLAVLTYGTHKESNPYEKRLDELDEKVEAISEYFKSGVSKNLFRYVRLFCDYGLFPSLETIQRSNDWVFPDPEKREKMNYFQASIIDLYNLRQDETMETTWEFLLQDLERAVGKGWIKQGELKLEKGKILVASHLKLQFEGEADHRMYNNKVPSIACKLAKKNNGIFLLDKLISEADTKSEKQTEESVRDFQEDIKAKFKIKSLEPIISILSEPNGKTVIFDPKFWTWQ